MNSRFDGWERFVPEITTKKLRARASAVTNGGTAPEDLAGNDLWFGLRTYEAHPTKVCPAVRRSRPISSGTHGAERLRLNDRGLRVALLPCRRSSHPHWWVRYRGWSRPSS